MINVQAPSTLYLDTREYNSQRILCSAEDQIDYYDRLYQGLNQPTSVIDLGEWIDKRQSSLGRKSHETICCSEIVDGNTCTNCGKVIETLRLVSDWRPSYTPYKRSSYFKECITKVQAKQTPKNSITQEIIQNIRKEILKTSEVYNLVTFRALLKKLGYNKLYTDSAWLLSVVQPESSIPAFNSSTEKILSSYFYKICVIWNDVKPSTRKTMIPYKYIFRKIVELEQCGDKGLFPLPGNIDKIIEYDSIWKCICEKNNWRFISSFSKEVF